MGAVADIVALLDKIPMWKRLTALPDQIAVLEKRIQALETGGAMLAEDQCPICKTGKLAITKEKPDPVGAALGFKTHVMQCDACG